MFVLPNRSVSAGFMKKRLINNRSGKPSKSKIIRTYLIIGIGLICCYLGVYHTHHHNSSLAVIIVIAGCLCIMTLQNMWFAAKNPKWFKIRGFLAVLLVASPITFGVYKLQKLYCRQQLSDHGIIAHAKVVKLFRVRNKSAITHYAKFAYEVNGKIWHQKLVNNQSRIGVDDILTIRCSSEQPDIIEVLAIKKAHY